MICSEDYTLMISFVSKGFPCKDQIEELFIVCCNCLLYLFPTRNIVNFLINFTFLTATYFSKAWYILFMLKVPLNPNQSIGNYKKTSTQTSCRSFFVLTLSMLVFSSAVYVRASSSTIFQTCNYSTLCYPSCRKGKRWIDICMCVIWHCSVFNCAGHLTLRRTKMRLMMMMWWMKKAAHDLNLRFVFVTYNYNINCVVFSAVVWKTSTMVVFWWLVGNLASFVSVCVCKDIVAYLNCVPNYPVTVRWRFYYPVLSGSSQIIKKVLFNTSLVSEQNGRCTRFSACCCVLFSHRVQLWVGLPCIHSFIFIFSVGVARRCADTGQKVVTIFSPVRPGI